MYFVLVVAKAQHARWPIRALQDYQQLHATESFLIHYLWFSYSRAFLSLMDSKVHSWVHKRCHSQTNPVLILIIHSFKIYFNIVLSFKPRSSEWSLPFMVSNQNFVNNSLFPIHMHKGTCPCHPPLFSHCYGTL